MKNILLFIFFLVVTSGIGQTQEFVIDKGHTFITFSIERFGTVDVMGRFNDFAGVVLYNPESESISEANLTIQVESIDTGHSIRDGHLKSGIWMDAENFPTISFQTKSIAASEEGFIATADLTIHGETNEVKIPFLVKGPSVDPTQNNAIGISAELVVNRQDYGIAFSRLMTNGNLFIGNEVKIKINALAAVEK